MRAAHVATAALFAFSLTLTRASSAFVPSPVGGHPGEADVGVRATLERGKVEPSSNEASFQAATWEVYQLGGGYTFEPVGPLLDLRASLDVSYFRSVAEVNDPARGAVAPASCRGVSLDADRCEFHPANDGFFFTPRLAFNVVHNATLAFGFYAQGTIPVGIDETRFVLPRLDYVAGGVTFGAHVTDWLGVESNTYVGSGALDGAKQNGAVAQTLLVAFEAKKWILPWGAGIKVGTYFEGDLRDRFDERYEAAYTAAYPSRSERIRAMKFGIPFVAYARVTERAAVELGYVQKLFGYDAVATKTFYAGMRVVF